MNIKIKDFILKPEVNAPDKFNLYRIVEGMYEKDVVEEEKIIHKAGDVRYVEKFIGYAYSLERAVRIIIATHINDIGGNLELKSYINQFKVLKSEILKTLEV